MTVAVDTILDSVSPSRVRLRTLRLRYPLYIHNEFMTHRVFSRNASSNRAIPVKQMIADILRDPVPAPTWLENKAGMQGGEPITGEKKDKLDTLWEHGRKDAISLARQMAAQGAHKQHSNRVLAPYAHVNVLVSSTRWANFYALRDDPAAQPEIRLLAQMIRAAEDDLTPNVLQPGQWHMPFVTAKDWSEVNGDGQVWGVEHIKTLIKISVARCARVSYLTVEGAPPTIKQDLELYERLVGSRPLHASPAEHQATPDIIKEDAGVKTWGNPGWHGNFAGWIQYRQTLPGQYVPDAPFSAPEPKVNVDLSSAAGEKDKDDVPTEQPGA